MLAFAITPVLVLALSCLGQAIPDVAKDIEVNAQKAADGRPISGALSMAGGFGGSYFCETTIGSPWSRDVSHCADKLSWLGETRCVQRERYGSSCNRLMEADSAAVSICGPWDGSMPCNRIAFAANTIAHKCSWHGRSGGYYIFDDAPEYTFPVHRS